MGKDRDQGREGVFQSDVGDADQDFVGLEGGWRRVGEGGEAEHLGYRAAGGEGPGAHDADGCAGLGAGIVLTRQGMAKERFLCPIERTLRCSFACIVAGCWSTTSGLPGRSEGVGGHCSAEIRSNGLCGQPIMRQFGLARL